MLGEALGTPAAPTPRPTMSQLSDVPLPLFGATPIPPPAPLVQTPRAGGASFRFSDMLRADGTLDAATVYRYGQVPDVAISAEQILQALAKLPADVPESVRRAALKVTVNSLAQATGIPVDTVVADARLRHTRMTQFRDALTAEWERESRPLRETVAEIETQIATYKARLDAARAALEAREAAVLLAQSDCANHLRQLDGVIRLLAPDDTLVAYLDAPLPARETELPPHLRDDSVKRLLGIVNEG